MKISAIIRIAAFSLAILLLVFILFSVLDQNYYIEDGKIQHFTNAGDEEIEAPYEVVAQGILLPKDIRSIDIEWVSGNITIKPDENYSEIFIQENSPLGSGHKMVYKQSGQTLKIKFSEESIKFSSFGINADVSKDLIIIVPADWNYNKLEIDAATADVEIHNLRMNELDFDGASGNLTLDQCDVDVLDIDTASGDVEFTGRLDELDFDAASARFSGEFYKVPSKLNLDAMSGDMELVLPEDSGFYLELDTMSGSFDSDFDFHTTGAHYECGDSACKIKISALSGDVSILKGVPSPAKNCDH